MLLDQASLFVRARILALKRRIAIRLKGEFDPYPICPDGMDFSPSQRIDRVSPTLSPQLGWGSEDAKDVGAWQTRARERWRALINLPVAAPEAEILSECKLPIAAGYSRRRAYLRFGPGWDAPVDIIGREDIPHDPDSRPPVVICMQGTNSGAHLSLGEVRMPSDFYKVKAGSALALQAADNGMIALSFERACFGERRERHLRKRSESPTVDNAFHQLLLGQTQLGQTVAELESLVKWVNSDVSSGSPVYLAGYSAAGTASLAAAAASELFSGIAVGGCVGMVRDTLLKRGAGGYNNIPHFLEWFETDALVALIAPRPCIVIAGVTDHIWPYSAADKVVSSARSAWSEQSAGNRIELLKGQKGHTYYPDLMWPALTRLAGKH